MGLAADAPAANTIKQVNISLIAAMVKHLPGTATLPALLNRGKQKTQSKRIQHACSVLCQLCNGVLTKAEVLQAPALVTVVRHGHARVHMPLPMMTPRLTKFVDMILQPRK